MRIRRLTVAAVAVLLLAACGGNPLDDKNGQEVASAAATALEDAGAVHVKGSVDQGGEAGRIDLQLQGEDASGTITFNGADVQLLNVGGQAYLQAPVDFWTSFGLPEEATALFEGKWIVVPDEAAAQFQDFSLGAFVDDLRHPTSDVKNAVTSDEVDGDPVVVIEQEDGSTLTVANAEKAYPLALTNEGDSPSSLTFSDFGEKDDISAPSDPIDLSELAGG
ncbi:MAG: putative Lipoprotein [Blastococcus sp.]|jgi:hypothetical protein|nr:putative Lipoprotein [Blastococcus sp.]